MEKILIVDDESGITDVSNRILKSKGYSVMTAASGEEALEILENETFDLALIDLRMPGIDGMELLRRIKKLYPTTEVVIITAEVTIESAIESLKLGAFDYILKPFNLSELVSGVKRAIDYSQLRRKENIFRETTYLYQLAQEISKTHSKEDLLKFILERAAQVLNADSGSILMHIPERDTLKLMSCYGFDAPLGSEVKMGERIAGWVALNRKPLLLIDPNDLPQFKGWAVRKDIASSIVAPLIKHDTLLGVVSLNRFVNLTNVKFTPHDLESLELFAIHSALIIALHRENRPPKFE
ncbi:MAG: response regulator [Endomicrobiales bacterium]